MGREAEAKIELQQLNVRVPKSVHDALRLYSHTTGTTINELVLRALADFLGDRHRNKEFDEMLKKVRSDWRVALDKLA